MIPLKHPWEAILPVIGIDKKNNSMELLGTGFFIDSGTRFITAKHVTESLGKTIAIPFLKKENSMFTAFTAKVLVKHPVVDLALLDIENYPRNKPLSTITCNPHKGFNVNNPVACFEYSQARSYKPKNDEKLRWWFNGATRLGNVTRLLGNEDLLNSPYEKSAGDNALELSFPLLRGASGSPIILNGTNYLIGISIANVQRELHPAQIEQTWNEGKLEEEIKYMLPQGIAVNANYVSELIS